MILLKKAARDDRDQPRLLVKDLDVTGQRNYVIRMQWDDCLFGGPAQLIYVLLIGFDRLRRFHYSVGDYAQRAEYSSNRAVHGLLSVLHPSPHDLNVLQDEPFHVPQVQAYCNGDWSHWDQKITTPPGL